MNRGNFLAKKGLTYLIQKGYMVCVLATFNKLLIALEVVLIVNYELSIQEGLLDLRLFGGVKKKRLLMVLKRGL